MYFSFVLLLVSHYCALLKLKKYSSKTILSEKHLFIFLFFSIAISCS